MSSMNPDELMLATLDHRRPTALIVDDDRDVREALADVLREDGFEVSQARDAAELLEIVRAAAREDGAPPDLIVSDIRMPGQSGLEALAELRSILDRTVLVFMTAFTDEAIFEEATRLGAIGVFRKPFDIDDLRTVARNLRRRDSMGAATRRRTDRP